VENWVTSLCLQYLCTLSLTLSLNTGSDRSGSGTRDVTQMTGSGPCRTASGGGILDWWIIAVGCLSWIASQLGISLVAVDESCDLQVRVSLPWLTTNNVIFAFIRLIDFAKVCL
jgi:hypothetical protein